MSWVVAGRVASVVAVTAGLAVGCARFDESASKPFTPAPTVHPEGMGPTNAPKTPPSAAPRPTGPCIDPDPLVIGTCLDTTGGVAPLPDGQQGLVTERVSGRILKVTVVTPDQPQPQPVEVARLDVDAAGDGGLTDVALSPTYSEDGLIYAYVTTPSDNRVVRIGAGGSVKPILTGIPKGSTGNRGAIDFLDDKMLVLTGDGGNPGAAADRGSLAGKLLRIDDPAPGGSNPQVLASGVGVAGGVCPDHKDSIWFTDRTAAADRLQRVAADGTVSTAWTWPDHPGVAGCAAAVDGVAIAMTDAKALAFADADPKTHAVTTAPAMAAQDKYGALNGAALAPDGFVWVGTINKQGKPGPFDDRVVRIPPPKGGAGGGPD
ncbi:PQQ-dependent sugar dehydrogenase [Nocardia sp. CDC159]|uniref:PQQ-dependent sugar dehydrogenase n=1 Tax=Nocardia pulmonis TaxID=2951408 RepID=A0A9X2EEA5_9NOCA|nr:MULTISPECIES: PQQ-dependent sugar dehydrogenase [Nocardia]MCM6776566.1 PQQ-dependent sugar dehydrogenase [Nocardia pulmonis]MCM6788990.1 PQQ-dependent sugar dehydrogenase [Nocardia sp. CDC159]